MKKNLFILVICIVPILLTHRAYANEGLNLDFAILKINKEVKSLSKEILSLKDEIELIKEGQRINSEKILELLKIIELRQSSDKKATQLTQKNQSSSLTKLYTDGKNEFTFGNYENAIDLLVSFAKKSPNSSELKDSKLWLARAYSASEKNVEAKNTYLDFQSNNNEHAKYANSMFELSRVLVKLNKNNEARLLLLDMINKYPSNSLINKANQLLLDL